VLRLQLHSVLVVVEPGARFGVVGIRENRAGTRKQGVFIEHPWSLVNMRKGAFLGVAGSRPKLSWAPVLYFCYIGAVVEEGGFIATL